MTTPTYQEKYGALPRFTFWGDEEEGVAKLLSGFSPDVIFPCFYKIKKWYETGRLDAVDTAKLSHWEDIIFQSLRALDGVEQGGNVLSPPLILTREEIDHMVVTLRDAIGEVQDDLVREGLWKG